MEIFPQPTSVPGSSRWPHAERLLCPMPLDQNWLDSSPWLHVHLIPSTSWSCVTTTSSTPTKQRRLDEHAATSFQSDTATDTARPKS